MDKPPLPPGTDSIYTAPKPEFRHSAYCGTTIGMGCNCVCRCKEPGYVIVPHPCPYTEEMGGGGAECECCAYCAGQCAMDV